MTADRLMPINALLGLCTPYDVNPSPLSAAGFRWVGLEVPLRCGDGGKVVADAVLVHDAAAHLVICEAKSGNNIEVEQAHRYSKITPQTVVHAVSLTLPRAVEPSIEVLYLGLDAYSDRMTLSLESAEVPYPLLSVADKSIKLLRADGASTHLRNALPGTGVDLIAPPVTYIPFDHDSEVDDFINPVRAHLVRATASGETEISIRALTERSCPYFLSYGQAARAQFIKKVQRAARQIAAELPATYAYAEAPGGGEGYIRILRTPEAFDARGRTQAYQALARQQPRRQPRVDPNQLDLLQELADSDDSGSDNVEERP
ncbi:hypothetical protein ACIOWI_25810 [Streptomyces sp. NPDC087659]|uniref:hypothetical protein n=1 Tax=Streptomyces sp. NPDC087659 TaxID=3365801 RepID=UPI00380F0378